MTKNYRPTLRMKNAIALFALLGMAGGAHAGGYDTGERDWDALFNPERFSVGVQTRYIAPQRQLTNVANTTNPGFSLSVNETEAFAVNRVDVSGRLGDYARCLASFRQPFEGHANYGSTWAGSASAIEQHFSSRDYGVTCAATMKLAKGQLSFLAGLSYQDLEYELTSNAGPGGIRRTLVKDNGLGWRAGVAFEIPDYALRASLIYNSQIDYDMTGNVSLSNLPGSLPIFGSLSMPQSVELKAQSGIAPKWLAFGSIKWTDWSVTSNMPLCAVGTPSCVQAAAVSGLTLLWEDTWTVTLGAARQFSDQFSVAGSLTYDQGASAGFTSQTDTWVMGLDGIYSPAENFQMKFGGTVGVLTSGTVSTAVLPQNIPNPVGYTASFGNDLVYSISASAKLRF